jgi:hypothetical protein
MSYLENQEEVTAPIVSSCSSVNSCAVIFINVLNGAKRLNPSIGLRAGYLERLERLEPRFRNSGNMEVTALRSSVPRCSFLYQKPDLSFLRLRAVMSSRRQPTSS